MSKLCGGATGVVACLHQRGVEHTLGLGHRRKPCKTGQQQHREGGSTHFDLTSKRAQENMAHNLCQREENFDTNPTQKESPRLDSRLRRYGRSFVRQKNKTDLPSW